MKSRVTEYPYTSKLIQVIQLIVKEITIRESNS